MVLTGEMIRATEAEKLGLVNRVVLDDQSVRHPLRHGKCRGRGAGIPGKKKTGVEGALTQYSILEKSCFGQIRREV
jgi:enoyl-CoA hydratase/carnithine racemase